MNTEEFQMMSDIRGLLRGMLNTLEVIERLLCDIRDQGKEQAKAVADQGAKVATPLNPPPRPHPSEPFKKG